MERLLLKNLLSVNGALGRCLRVGTLLGLLLGVAFAQAAESQPAGMQRYSDTWGPAVGTRLPLLEAADQTGTTRALGDLVGRKGLLLVLVRSADW